MAAAAQGLLPHGEPLDEDEDDNGRSFEAFERQYATDHSWESLQEDEQGFLRPLDATAELRARRQRAMSAAQSARIRKGMIRYLLLVLDLSRAASGTDLRPSRLSVMAGAARSFIRSFFDLNPLGQLGLVVLRDGVAQRLTELSGSPEAQVARLAQYGMDAGGDCSLQNGLELCHELLAGVPPYGHREVVALVAALSLVDPGRVEDSIAACKAAHIRVSVVGVAAEVHVLRAAAAATGGSYGVALNEAHLAELLLGHAPPPPAPPGRLGAELVRMGFPQRAPTEEAAAVFVGELPVRAAGGYACPRCKARTAELPTRCHVCGLMLISSPHLARSYHHLFPVPPFEEVTGGSSSGGDSSEALAAAAAEAAVAAPGRGAVTWHEPGGGRNGGSSGAYCYGCLRGLGTGAAAAGAASAAAPAAGAAMVLRCRQCRQLFCYECDAFVHEALHNCPGCECGAAADAGPGDDATAAAAAAAGAGGASGGVENGTPVGNGMAVG